MRRKSITAKTPAVAKPVTPKPARQHPPKATKTPPSLTIQQIQAAHDDLLAWQTKYAAVLDRVRAIDPNKSINNSLDTMLHAFGNRAWQERIARSNVQATLEESA